MTLQGMVQNGVIVLPQGQSLPEGAIVHVSLQPAEPQYPMDGSQRTIGEELAALGREVESLPCELPEDLAINHDHYLYGVPKRQ